MKTDKDEIIVKDPNIIGSSSIPAERTPIGIPDDYKPSIALLPNGEILLIGYHQYFHTTPYSYSSIFDNVAMKKDTEREILLYRSQDRGINWSERNIMQIPGGKEPFLSITKKGTIFITHRIMSRDVDNLDEYTSFLISRSEDNGYSWETRRIGRKEMASPNATYIGQSRNIVETPYGSLLIAFSDKQLHSYIWESFDEGKTWGKKERFSLRDDKEGLFAFWYGFFTDSYLWYSKPDRLLILARTESAHYPIEGRTAPKKQDCNHRFILFESIDHGRTAKRVKDFTDYGEMFPSILRLKNGHLLLTFTVRALKRPLGVQAVLGKETEDGGFLFDFEHDRIIIDAKTPDNQSNGGGYGNTIELEDSSLVTSYSYRGADGRTYMEVVRWKLDL